MEKQSPLILTLKIDPVSFEYFNSLRKKHFPAEINYIDAHLTLFHHLPNIDEIRDELNKISEEQSNFNLDVISLMKLGRGVAFKINCQELEKLHSDLQKKWDSWLIPQDKQKLRPHITIQNKVKPEHALLLHDQLSLKFESFSIRGIGFSLWKYLGGPWSKIKDYNFENFSSIIES